MLYVNKTEFRSDYNNDDIQPTWTVDGMTRRVIDKNKETTTIDGVPQSHVYASFTCPGNLTLLASNNNGTVQWNASARLYGCQIYDNGKLARNYEACIDPSGTVGLYDHVHGAFYGNAGTGTFTAGPEAPPETVNRLLLFEAYQGRDLSKDQSANPRVVLTDASLLSPTYTWDSSIHKNLAYVYTDTQVLKVDSSNGEERRELWVNGNDINPEDYPTTAAYTAALIQRGIDRLAELPIAESFESGLQATANGYKTAWDLGDIVTVRMTRWNKTASARVTEVEEIYEGGTAEIIPVLGSPLPEKLMIGDGF